MQINLTLYCPALLFTVWLCFTGKQRAFWPAVPYKSHGRVLLHSVRKPDCAPHVKGHVNILNLCCFSPQSTVGCSNSPRWIKCPGVFHLHTQKYNLERRKLHCMMPAITLRAAVSVPCISLSKLEAFLNSVCCTVNEASICEIIWRQYLLQVWYDGLNII